LCQHKNFSRFYLIEKRRIFIIIMADITQYVQAGACVRSGGAPGVFGMVVGCALEREACEGTIFRSSRELILEGSDTVGYVCLENTLDVPVGRCKGDPSFVCTGNAGSCLDEGGFYPRTDDCSMLVDKSPQRQQNRTLFGGCRDTQFLFSTKCYWSDADCDTEGSEGIQWLSSALSSKCTCEETLTGACEHNGNYYCAVSELGCDTDSTFVPPAQLPEDVTCFLCEKQDESFIEMKSSQIAEPESSTPQISSQNQPAVQGNFPTESPQSQPTSSPENNISTTFPTSGPDDTKAKVIPRNEFHFQKEKDNFLLYVGISTVLAFALLLCLAITSTGSNASKQVNDDNGSNEEEDLFSNPTGELA